MEIATISQIPTGNILLIHPQYVHYAHTFIRDKNPFLPTGLLYAGEMIEQLGLGSVEYHDMQLHDMNLRTNLHTYDSYGIHTMGAQNIAPAHALYTRLVDSGISPDDIYLGGQGVEGLDTEEFRTIFPHARRTSRRAFSRVPGYWDVSLERQLRKIPEEDMQTYLRNEMTLLFSQGCAYSCTFCGAQTGQRESFYNTSTNLELLVQKAQLRNIGTLDLYATSLDFFQQARGRNPQALETRIRTIQNIQESYGVNLRLRALSRANSYLRAAESGTVDLARDSGVYQIGFGADGAADVSLLRAMRKGTRDLRSDLLAAFAHAERKGISPEILYVFGIPEDSPDSLVATRDLCCGLLNAFPTSISRTFPAKNAIPGNQNWKGPAWTRSEEYKALLSRPALFANLGFETLANHTSHPDKKKRILVNQYAVEMSHAAHNLGRVQSFLTVPIMESDGTELMDEKTFELFREIVHIHAPEISKNMTRKNLPDYRIALNAQLPKDK